MRRRELSWREILVLEHVAAGLTNRGVATALGLSPQTIKTHLERVYWKLGAESRAHAVALGFRAGLLR